MRKKLLRSRSGFEKPESREEAIMQNILGASNVLEPSESNIEEILKSILYNTPYTKEAEFEIEKILLAIKNNSTYDGEGESRDMKILIAILNDLYYTEEAESRIEELLIEWLYQRTPIKVIEGVPPLSFKSKGYPLTAWSITGNTVQNGTPTPENPVDVQCVGDYDSETGLYKIPVVTRGKNLFDYKTMYGVLDKYLNENGEVLNSFGFWAITDYIPCSGTVFTINSIGGILPAVCLYDSHKNFITGLAYGTGGAELKKPITIKSETNASYIRFSYCIMSKPGTSDDLSKIQIEEGSTATPYEPYHEPIITPIYLPTPLYSGEVMRSNGTITRSDGTTETFTAPQIPTLNGTTIIDVYTAVKPSNVYIEYK